MNAIRVANTPASWGVLEFGLAGEAPGYEQVLDEIAGAGYVGTELGDWGFMPTEPDALRAALASRGLALVGAFVPVALARPEAHAEGIGRALRVARLLRAAEGPEPYVVLADDNGTVAERTQNAGRVTPAMGLSDAHWRIFARGAETIAGAVRAGTGLRTVFHHHCGGYVETPAEIERLMALTDPALLGLCLDTGHATFGGGDPLALLGRYGARIWHVHWKDCHPAIAAQAAAQGWDYLQAVRQGVFCELGQGSVDFAAVGEALRATGYAGWIVVEQDVLPGMGAPLESARRNRAYMRGLGL
jgi:inosose dehydratase